MPKKDCMDHKVCKNEREKSEPGSEVNVNLDKEICEDMQGF